MLPRKSDTRAFVAEPLLTSVWFSALVSAAQSLWGGVRRVPAARISLGRAMPSDTHASLVAQLDESLAAVDLEPGVDQRARLDAAQW